MGRVSEIFKGMALNKVLNYLVSRYVIYFIQFVNSIFIAIYLGPLYLGVWGFISLVDQYIGQFNFGITYSVNAIASINKNRETYIKKIVGVAISLLIILSIVVVIFFIANYIFGFKIGEKFNFSKYVIIVCSIAIINFFNSLLSNLFRIYGKLFEIAFYQSIYPIIILIAIFFWKGDELLWAMVIINFVSTVASFLLFFVKSPIQIRPLWNLRLSKKILHMGWHLFVYNTSFYLIIITTRSFVSQYYTVQEFGYFTFAFSLANAILLLLQSLSFLIYPKLLNRFATASKERSAFLLSMVRDAYITTSHALIHIAIFIFPLFLFLFPKYESAGDAFKMIALAVVLYSNSFGYQGLIVAKGGEIQLGLFAFGALCINVIVAFVLVLILNVPYSYVIISTMVTYLIYVYCLGFLGRKRIDLKTDFFSILKDVYPHRLFIPYLTSICLILFKFSNIYFILPLMIFLLFNYREFWNIKNVTKQIIVNPDYINI